jgi:hypothetical protein
MLHLSPLLLPLLSLSRFFHVESAWNRTRTETADVSIILLPPRRLSSLLHLIDICRFYFFEF